MDEEAVLNNYGAKCADIFKRLFDNAKLADEFEYVCTLLRFRGDVSAACDPFVETNLLISDLLRLISESSKHRFTQIRLELLLYSHITEADSVYFVIENLLNVCSGKRYNHHPFQLLYKTPRKAKPFRINQIPPSAHSIVGHLMRHAHEVAQDDLVEIINLMFNSGVRNAFAHADYALVGREFRTREGWLDVDGLKSRTMSLDRLEMQIRQGFLFYEAFFKEYEARKRAYTVNTQTTGRLIPGSRIPVQILADKARGVYGFVATNPDQPSTDDPQAERANPSMLK